MKLVDDNDIEVQLNAVSTKDDSHLWSVSEVVYKTGGPATTSETNVIWVQNPWTQLTSNEKSAEMPAAIGSSQHPNNEECGIRDVWAHNLEDEFRTIRQVMSIFHLRTVNYL